MPGKPVFHEKIAASGAASELNIPNQRAINLENPGAVWDRFAKDRFGMRVYIYIYIYISIKRDDMYIYIYVRNCISQDCPKSTPTAKSLPETRNA